MKYHLFSNDPRVQLAIDDVHGFRYVIVDGTVESPRTSRGDLSNSRPCATSTGAPIRTTTSYGTR